MIRWRGLLVHHSASPDGPLDNWAGIVAFHTNPPPRGRGWRAVGYHFGIELDRGFYVVRPGRSTTMTGAHCPGRNQLDLGICLVGDFTREQPPRKQLDALIDLCSQLCADWNIPSTEIRPHRRFRQTECPGKAFTDELFVNLRAEVGVRLTNG